MHLLAEVSGEQVVAVKPIIGYLHRGIEKIAEERTTPRFRCCAIAWITGRVLDEMAYCGRSKS